MTNREPIDAPKGLGLPDPTRRRPRPEDYVAHVDDAHPRLIHPVK